MKKFLSRYSKLSLTFLCIDILLILLLVYKLIRLDILPFKYLIIAIIVLLVLLGLIMLFTQKRSKKALKVVGVILTIITISVSTVGAYYTSTIVDFLSKAFKEGKDTYTSTYYVLTKQDTFNDIKELNDKTIGYFELVPNINDALNKLKETVSFTEQKYDNVFSTFNDVNNKKIAATYIEKNLYESLLESVKDLKEANYKVLYSVDIEVENEVSKKEVNGDYVNVYLGGTDFANNFDFNMLITINKKTHKILLTSIPRDFYVYVPKLGMRDLLGYAGGVNNSIGVMENLFSVDVNYFLKVNTHSIIGLVDTLGGVEFCSDKSFTTTHALITDTYDDTKGPKLNVKKGCHTYKGIEILTISRERKAYPDGDRQRQKNCQAIMISLFKKMASLNSLTNFSNVLNKVSELYSTNIPQDLVTEIAKSAIDGNNWTFDQQSVTGGDSSDYVHLGTVKDYVMRPNQDSVSNASAKMKSVMYES